MATNYSSLAGGAPAVSANPSGGGYLDANMANVGFNAQQNAANTAATTAYNNAKLQGDADTLAYQKAQAAYTDALASATTFGVSPGGTYNGVALPAAGTPTMAQMAQWAQLYGTAAAPANQYEMTLAAKQQQFNQQQQGQQQYANLSGTYTPTTGGSLSSNVNVNQIDAALQNALGRMYNQDVFKSMTSSLQGQNLSNPQALSAINAAIKSSTQGAMQGVGDIAGALGQGAYTAPQDALTMAAQQQYGAMYGYAGAPLAGQMTQSMQQQLANEAIQQSQATGMYYAPNYTPQAQQQTSSWDQISGQLQTAAGANYNDAAAKAAFQNLSGQGANNFNGQTAAPLTQAQMQTIYNAAGAPASAYGAGAQQGGAAGGQAGGQMTQSYQNQMFNQALQTAQFQADQAQKYLQMQSQLSGPADYGKYLQLMNSTPQGLRSLVQAGAGAYLPGGGTTGQQPTAQSLGNMVGQATGGGVGGSPAAGTSTATGGSGTSYQDYINAAQNLPAPSQLAPQAMAAMSDTQKQMLQGMYQQMGYTSNDVQSLFNQSLPKYAAGGGQSTGSFRLQ